MCKDWLGGGWNAGHTWILSTQSATSAEARVPSPPHSGPGTSRAGCGHCHKQQRDTADPATKEGDQQWLWGRGARSQRLHQPALSRWRHVDGTATCRQAQREAARCPLGNAGIGRHPTPLEHASGKCGPVRKCRGHDCQRKARDACETQGQGEASGNYDPGSDMQSKPCRDQPATS